MRPLGIVASEKGVFFKEDTICIGLCTQLSETSPQISESSTCIDIGRTLCLRIQVQLGMKANHLSALAVGS